MNDLILADRELEVGFIGQLVPCLMASKEWTQAIRLRQVTNSS